VYEDGYSDHVLYPGGPKHLSITIAVLKFGLQIFPALGAQMIAASENGYLELASSLLQTSVNLKG
jgi:hypothetical protein